MLCPYCETELKVKGNYCVSCGGRLSNDGLPLDATLSRIYNEWKSYYYRYKKIGKSTKGNYSAAFNHLNAIKNIPFCKLRTKDYQELIDSISFLSASSLDKVKQLLRHLSDYAIMEDIIKTNYAQFIDVPKSNKEEVNIFSDSQVVKLYYYSLNKSKHQKSAEITLVLIFTGFRPSELFSIKDFAVDLEEKVIVGGMKTAAGKNRIIPICGIIWPIIKKWLDDTPEGDYIVRSPREKQLQLDKWRKRDFYPLMEEIGFNSANDDEPFFKPYSARHTFATIGEQAGIRPRLLSKICGHTSTAFTNRVYIHTRAKELRAEMSKIDFLFSDLLKEECAQ